MELPVEFPKHMIDTEYITTIYIVAADEFVCKGSSLLDLSTR